MPDSGCTVLTNHSAMLWWISTLMVQQSSMEAFTWFSRLCRTCLQLL